jgi:ABC-type arginine transport system permease subunit
MRVHVSRHTQLIREMAAMAWEACTDKEPRSIGAAVRHGRFGSACAAAMVALALAVSICALVLMLGIDGAFAATSRLITIDGQGLHYGMLVPVLLIVIALGYFAFDGLAPAYVRVYRNRR